MWRFQTSSVSRNRSLANSTRPCRKRTGIGAGLVRPVRQRQTLTTTLPSSSPTLPRSTTLALFPFLTLPSFDIFTPLSTLFLSHPLPTYTSSIIVLTLLIRTLITLPVTLWSRIHIARLRTLVLPLLKKKNTELAYRLVPECRKLGLSHDEYVRVLQSEIKKTRTRVLKEYNVRPRLTALLPPLVHLPLFLGLSVTIREATRLATDLNTLEIASVPSTESLTESPTPTPGASPTPIDPTQDPSLLSIPESISPSLPDLTAHLTSFLSETPLHLTSLINPDPTLILPFVIGLTAFSNVELMQSWRTAVSSTTPIPTHSLDSDGPKRGPTGKIVADPFRRPTKRTPRSILETVPAPGTSGSSSTSDNPGTPGTTGEEKEQAVKLSTRVIGFALRGLAVASIGFAAEAPAAVAIYWTTSTIYTLVQNYVLLQMEKKGRLPWVVPRRSGGLALDGAGTSTGAGAGTGAGTSKGSGLLPKRLARRR